VDALALGTLTVLDDEIAEFTAEAILGLREEMTEFTMFPWPEEKPVLWPEEKPDPWPEEKLDPWPEEKLDPALRVVAPLLCPTPKLMGRYDVVCPREEVLDAEPAEDEDMADWTAELIWGCRAPRIWAIRSDWDRPRFVFLVAETEETDVSTSSTPARGPVQPPGISLS